MRRYPLRAGVTLGVAGAALLLGCGPGEEAPSGGLADQPEPEGVLEEPPAEPTVQVSREIPADVGVTPGGFQHAPHREIDCTICHADPGAHGPHFELDCASCHYIPAPGPTSPVSERECAVCHHEEARDRACVECHEEFLELSPIVAVTFVAAVGAEAKQRDLALDHSLHSSLACRDCHSAGPNLGVERSCASCHDSHHVPDADCAACHSPSPLALHDTESHRGCAGPTCHVEPTVTGLPRSRAVCLSCHQDQNEHEPGQECIVCHAVAPPGTHGLQAGGGT